MKIAGGNIIVCFGMEFIMKNAERVKYPGVAIAVVLADQLSKYLVSYFLPAGGRIQILSSYLEICNSQNSGFIFGIGSTWGQKSPYLVLAGLFLAAVLAVTLVWGYRFKARHTLVSLVLPFLIGGGLGNFIDRLFRGAVVDWINSSLFTGPVNIADIAVFTALFVFGYYVVKEKVGIVNGKKIL